MPRFAEDGGKNELLLEPGVFLKDVRLLEVAGNCLGVNILKKFQDEIFFFEIICFDFCFVRFIVFKMITKIHPNIIIKCHFLPDTIFRNLLTKLIKF